MSRYGLVDIGGTAIKTATFDGEISEVVEYPTEAKKGGEHIVKKVIDIFDSMGKLEAIGISTAGFVEPNKGYIISANDNIPFYSGTKWKDILEERYSIPVFVDNDVNCAALGEGIYGCARDCSDYICLTYGTGVGGAIVMNNKIYRGASGGAGEFGAMLTHCQDHEPLKPYSGGYESYASTFALVQKLNEYDSSLTNGREIFARINEPKIQELVDEWIKEIALGLISLIHIFNPKVIVLGGGIMELDYVFDKVKDFVCDNIMSNYLGVSLKKAALGNKAGIYGALVIVQEGLKEKSL